MAKNNTKDFLNKLLGGLLALLNSEKVQKAILAFLEKEAVKFILKKVVITGGFKIWLITWVVGELVEETDERLIEPAFRKVGFAEDHLDGARVFRKVDNAQNVNDWVNSLNDA